MQPKRLKNIIMRYAMLESMLYLHAFNVHDQEKGNKRIIPG